MTQGYGNNTLFRWSLGKLSQNAYLAEDILRLVLSVSRPSDYLDSVTQSKPSEAYHLKIVNSPLARDCEAAIRYLKLDVLTEGHREF